MSYAPELSIQPRGVPAKMILHEGGNEVVAVIVAAVAAQLERNVCLGARTFQQFRAQLLVEEWIGLTYID